MNLGKKNHHPIFEQFERWEGTVDAGWQADFLGVLTRTSFFTMMDEEPQQRYVRTEYPPVDEEYFEWIDLLEAVVASSGTFVMIELGAGWGRWLIRAAIALRQRGPQDRDVLLVGVEAEPQHFRWMKQHFLDNGVDPRMHILMRRAIASRSGLVWFRAGTPKDWYGQFIPPAVTWREIASSVRAGIRRQAHRKTLRPVRAVSLKSILRRVDRVDLLDLDVQGSEAEVLEAALGSLNDKVARIHIGTHSREIEDNLRRMFRQEQWTLLNDYACSSTSETPYGIVQFGDGVQTWLNPRLGQRRTNKGGAHES